MWRRNIAYAKNDGPWLQNLVFSPVEVFIFAQVIDFLVRTAGVEPARGFPQRILSPPLSLILFLSGSTNSFAKRL